MDATRYIAERYNLDLSRPSPIEIADEGRDVLGHWFKDLGYQQGAEIGVERGIFSKILLDANPNMTLHCVDAWQPYAGYEDSIGDDRLPTKFEETKKRLSGYSVKLHRNYSMDAVLMFKDEELDFVYIDANHSLPWVMDDIIHWSKKVRPGGIVAGHDYIQRGIRKSSPCHVRQTVHWYAELKPIKTWFLIGSQERIEGQKRDNNRSWFYVKE